MRINKYLATAGVASRRKAEELIKSGRIKVNGVVTTELSTDVKVDDIVLFDDKKIKIAQQFEYYLLNKPKGYISSAKDDRNRKTVVDLINTKTRIFPIGRLDFESEGLLLLTNDGELTYKLTHPKHNISKTYLVNINSTISKGEIEKLQNGVVIDEYKLHGCKINILESENNTTKMKVTIFEGRNREIRKMFEVVGKKVVFLKRIKIADLELGNLKRGEYRTLSQKEIDYLYSL